MDIFKQNRNLVVAVVIMIVLNLGLLFLLWQNISSPTVEQPKMRNWEERKSELSDVLRKELDFSDKQIDEYLDKRFELQENVRMLQMEVQFYKKKMFDEVLKEDSNLSISESVLNLSLQSQAEIEKLTFQHFVDLKNICNAEQKEKLKSIMHRLIAPPRGDGNQPLHPPGGRPDKPPHR